VRVPTMSRNGMTVPVARLHTANIAMHVVRIKKEARRPPGYTRALFRRKDGINNVNHTISAFNIRLNDYGIVHR
jgi:hypothetical protein